MPRGRIASHRRRRVALVGLAAPGAARMAPFSDVDLMLS
jgi:hypothetical protein